MSLLKSLVEELPKVEGERIVFTGDEESYADISYRSSSGSFILDTLIGGGFPSGRMIELHALPNAGKTTIATHAMIHTQQSGGYSLLIDTECKWDKKRAVNMGLDPSKHLTIQAKTLEDGFEAIYSVIEQIRDKGKKLEAELKKWKAKKDSLIPKMYENPDEVEIKDQIARSAAPLIVVWDTVSAAPTRQEVQGGYGNGMMEKPRYLRAQCRVLMNFLARQDVVCLLINQVHQVPGPGKYIMTKSSSAGFAIPFHAVLSLKLKKKADYQDGDKTVGIMTEIKCHKSQLAAPFEPIHTYINFETGIDELQEVFCYLEENTDYVKKKGAWMSIHEYPSAEEEKSFYRKDLPEMNRQDPKLMEHLKSLLLSHLN